eukprot:237276-Chlamydomonas_euryale.AAC.2
MNAVLGAHQWAVPEYGAAVDELRMDGSGDFTFSHRCVEASKAVQVGCVHVYARLRICKAQQQ